MQSGSARVIYDIYNRNIKPKRILEAARLLNRYSENLLPSYDFIFDNPYETSGDRLETARLINALPKPYALQTFSLVFLPGTKLTEKAIKDGIIGSDLYAGYEKRANHFNTDRVSYLKLVCLILPSLPARIGALLTFKPLALLLDSRIFEPVFTLSAKVLFRIKATLQLRRTNTTSVLRR